jgi:thiol-disulfide isomerase/thioredoxin
VSLLCVATCVLPQKQPTGIRSLTIGDMVPDVEFNNILNYHSKTAKLSDFKAKSVIIDFFATWCGSCIKALPKLDSLKKQFGDKLEILVVSYEPMETISAFFKRNKIAAATNLPFIANDKILDKYFPHKLIPHEVWISTEGEVKAITGAYRLTGNNITDFVSGINLNMPLKKDIMDYDKELPLLENGNGGDISSLSGRSVLTKRLDGMRGSIGRVRQGDFIKYFFINYPVLSIYSSALKFKGKQIILEVNDPSRYLQSDNDRDVWENNNLYSYELILDKSIPEDQVGTFIVQDLNRYLKLYGRMEKRSVSCWAVIKSKERSKLYEHTTDSSYLFDENEKEFKAVANKPFSQFVSLLNKTSTPIPNLPIFVDETGIKRNVSIKIPAKFLNNINELKKELQEYGLDLTRVSRVLDMFVLSDKM